MNGEVFLYRWMDEIGLRDRSDIPRALSSAQSLSRLEELAQSEGRPAANRVEDARPTIAVGRGLDLSGYLDCYHPKCQLAQVNELFRRVLHYFDQVIIAGPQAHEYARNLGSGNRWFLETVIPSQIEVLLALRELGVIQLVRFVEKDPACTVHYRQHAREAGVLDLLEGSDAVIQDLATSGALRELRRRRNHWYYTFDSPLLEHTSWGVVDSRKRPDIRHVAGDVLLEYMSHLTSDVITAKRLNVSLGVSIPLHRMILERAGVRPTEENVLFELRLPALEGIPFADLVELRENESVYFEAFRVRAAVGRVSETRQRR